MESCNLLKEYAIGIPKCELHVHIEGTITVKPPSVFFGENHTKASPYVSLTSKSNLSTFLKVYYANITNHLRSEKDFYRLGMDYFQRAAEQNNIRHVEFFFDPQAHTQRHLHFDTIVSGLRTAQQHSLQQYGIHSTMIMCFLRDHSIQSAFEILQKAVAYKDCITAVGLDSKEIGFPCRLFQEVFDKARTFGFKTVAHAGEEGPASNIEEALDLLRVSRVDHGNRCVDNPALVNRLIQEKVPLTVCPLSGVALGHYDGIQNIPLLTQGAIMGEWQFDPQHKFTDPLVVTINSDDPAYFGGYLNDNYIACINQPKLQWDFDVVKRLAQNSVNASFMPDTQKVSLLAEIQTYHQRFCQSHHLPRRKPPHL